MWTCGYCAQARPRELAPTSAYRSRVPQPNRASVKLSGLPTQSDSADLEDVINAHEPALRAERPCSGNAGSRAIAPMRKAGWWRIRQLPIASMLRSWRRQRLAFLDDIYGERLVRPIARIADIVHKPGRKLTRTTCLHNLVRFAIDLQDDLSFHGIVGLDTRMGMPPRAGTRRNFSDHAHRLIAARKIDSLKRRPRDAGLLC